MAGISLPPLDLSGGEPIYRQLAGMLRAEIESGRLRAGDRLPPTRELAARLKLNRATVSAAYEILENSGLITGHVGRGSFVAGAALALPGPEGPERKWSWSDRLGAPPEPPAADAAGVEFRFDSSRPAAELFPTAEFRAACEEALRHHARQILELGSPVGYAPLRRYLLEDARRQSLAREDDDLLVTSGCQQAIDLLARLLAGPGDTVLVEDPIYPGLKNVFQRGQCKVAGIPVGESGMDLDALEQAIARLRPRLVVVTPSFQNPMGTTMPEAARRRLLKLADAAKLPVIENDIYGDLRYRGSPLPPLKEMDRSGLVIRIKSLSKLAFPGLRVGWVLANSAVIRMLAEAKQLADLHSDQLAQAALLRFLESGRMDGHRKKMLRAGSARLEAVLLACEAHLPAGSAFTRPEGGVNLWVDLPRQVDTTSMLAKAAARGVSYAPGPVFAVAREARHSLRLSFAGLDPVRIGAGVKRLGDLFREEIGHARPARPAALAPAMV
ncbi:MAG: PLP-dependent aminotransferase family protein [Bryobacteraceae bacterium]|nr:PLP-dependent aminotransferase family protein [Bryobacteraceae bacterium]